MKTDFLDTIFALNINPQQKYDNALHIKCHQMLILNSYCSSVFVFACILICWWLVCYNLLCVLLCLQGDSPDRGQRLYGSTQGLDRVRFQSK